MSLIDKLSKLAENKSPEVIDRVVKRARQLADDNLNGPERDIAKRALDRIGEASEALGHLGSGGLISLLARFHLGDEEEARLAFLAGSASYEELRKASHDLGEAAMRDRLNREAYWAEVRELVKDLGQIAVKVIPLLLMAA